MALIHWAELRPSKLELLQEWLPGQAWLGHVDPSGLASLGGYRFDDPAGAVGIETLLLGTESRTVLQVPLTYRAEPLTGTEHIATLQHSVLGRRWVYDGLTDPVYLQALATVVLTGGQEAELFRERDGRRESLPPTARVRGSGRPGTDVPEIRPGPIGVREQARSAEAGAMRLTVRHALDAAPAPVGFPVLTGTWNGQDEPRWLATVEPAP